MTTITLKHLAGKPIEANESTHLHGRQSLLATCRAERAAARRAVRAQRRASRHPHQIPTITVLATFAVSALVTVGIVTNRVLSALETA
jgi:hypothetical protein